MALAFDASAIGSTLPGTSITFSHTCTGSNLLLLVGIGVNGTNIERISGVTYNGVAMTRAVADLGGDSNVSSYIYYLINPTTGANNVVVSLSGSQFCRAISASYTGAKQSLQPDTTTTANTAPNNTASSLTGTLTVGATGNWVASVLLGDGGSAFSAGSGVNSVRNNVNTILYLGDSNTDVSAGSFSQSWTNTVAQHMSMSMISIKPDAVTTRGGAFLLRII